jgi:hypothetical protein
MTGCTLRHDGNAVGLGNGQPRSRWSEGIESGTIGDSRSSTSTRLATNHPMNPHALWLTWAFAAALPSTGTATVVVTAKGCRSVARQTR